ncbi:MAG: YkgJ family cysteine cluster protein [Myxococcota bacterium]
MTRRPLTVLDAEAANRTASVHAARPDWPCRAGCSQCCQSLAGPMRATALEWVRLDRALSQAEDADALRAQLAVSRRSCPLLHVDTGRCRFYAARPLACRAYGYYVARDGRGRWCEAIEARSDLDTLMFGHEGSLDDAGPTLTFQEWLELPER